MLINFGFPSDGISNMRLLKFMYPGYCASPALEPGNDCEGRIPDRLDKGNRLMGEIGDD